MQIGFTYDLRCDYLAAGFGEEETAEFDAIGTIEGIESALIELGHTVHRIGNARALIERLAAGERWDLVFNICEGLRGLAREAQVPSILDVFDIPYTFSDPAALVVCLDKALTKTVLRAAGVPTPDWFVVRALCELSDAKMVFPVIAKPIAEGTGKGIDGASKVIDFHTLERTCNRLLERYRQPVIIEQFLPGREFTVGIAGSADDATVLGTLEIKLRTGRAEPDVYSYTNKENSEALVEYEVGNPMSDAQVNLAEAIALNAWRAVNGRDGGRIDLRCDASGRPQVLEVNPLAGLHPTHSDLPMIATARGISFVSLVRRIIESAQKRIANAELHTLADESGSFVVSAR